MRLHISKKARCQYECLKGRKVQFAEQVKSLLKDIQDHPLSGIGSPALVDPAIPNFWERRFNGSGILLYYYEEGEDCVFALSIVNSVLPSFEYAIHWDIGQRWM